MTKNKISTAMSVTLGVWIAALCSGAAVTYGLSRQLRVMATTAIEVPSGPMAEAVAEPDSVMRLRSLYPTVTIVGWALDRTAAAPASNALEDLADRQYVDSRELEMGGASPAPPVTEAEPECELGVDPTP